MALVLIKETGAGMADANTYAWVADGDAYHDGHLYAAAWTGATVDSKGKALVMATRTIDALFRFNGAKREATQALQWPRIECRDPDSESGTMAGLFLAKWGFLDETKVPPVVVQATCEFARELLEADRTDNPMGEGLKSLQITGALRIDFDPKDRQPPIPRLVQTLLEKYGEYLGRNSGAVRLMRT